MAHQRRCGRHGVELHLVAVIGPPGGAQHGRVVGRQVLAFEQRGQRYRPGLAQPAHAGLLLDRLQAFDARVVVDADEPGQPVLQRALAFAHRRITTQRQYRRQRFTPAVLHRADEEGGAGIGGGRGLAQQRGRGAARQQRQPGQSGQCEVALQCLGMRAQAVRRGRLDPEPGSQQQVVQLLQRLQPGVFEPFQAEVLVGLRAIAQALVDGRLPDAPQAEQVGVALARFGGGKLACPAPRGRRRLRQQRQQVQPAQRRRHQVLAPAQFAGRVFQARLELRRAALPMALCDFQRRQHQLDPRALEPRAQHPRARDITAKQQRLGEPATQVRGNTLRRVGMACQQPVFQRPQGAFGKTAELVQQPLRQLGLQRGFETAEQIAMKGLEHGRTQGRPPQVRTGVGQRAQSLQVLRRPAAVDQQAHRRGELFVLQETQRVDLLEPVQQAPGREPCLRLLRHRHHLAKTRLGVRRGGADAALRVARGEMRRQQPVQQLAHDGRIEGAAALGAQSGGDHHVRHPCQPRRRL